MREAWLLKWQKVIIAMNTEGITVSELCKTIRRRFKDMTSDSYVRKILPELRKEGILISKRVDGRGSKWFLTEKGLKLKKAFDELL